MNPTELQEAPVHGGGASYAYSSRAPVVTVVIPTFQRPELVLRAVRSVLAQTFHAFEVVVVSDGPDPSLAPLLDSLGDGRVRCVELAAHGGANAARNGGAEAARGRWVALLDDDDEWLPGKLTAQMAAAERSRYASPIVACQLLRRTPRAAFVLPRRLPEPGEHISDYLFVRRGLFHGEGLIQTSTILAPRALFLRVPFAVGLRRGQETDWLLRAFAEPGVGLEVVPETLVLWHTDENRPRMMLNHGVWEATFAWMKESRPRLTPRAYAAYLMSVLSDMAKHEGAWGASRQLLSEAVRRGSPGPLECLTFFNIWVLPLELRHALRDRLLAQGNPRPRYRRPLATPREVPSIAP